MIIIIITLLQKDTPSFLLCNEFQILKISQHSRLNYLPINVEVYWILSIMSGNYFLLLILVDYIDILVSTRCIVVRWVYTE